MEFIVTRKIPVYADHVSLLDENTDVVKKKQKLYETLIRWLV